MCQKNKVLHRTKFNQEIFTKLLKTMHQLSINLLCSSDYRTTYSFCEIKHFVKQTKSLLIHFQGLLLKNITCVITSFLVLRVLYTILFIISGRGDMSNSMGVGIFWIGLNRADLGCWRLTLNSKQEVFLRHMPRAQVTLVQSCILNCRIFAEIALIL